MKRVHQKWLSILALLLAALLTVACASTGAKTEPSAETTEEPAASEAPFTVDGPSEDTVKPPEGTPPAGMPDGTPPEGFGNPPAGMPDGTPPEGGPGMGEPPSGKPDGTPPQGGNGMGEPPSGGMPGGPGGVSASDIVYSGAVEITSADRQTGKTYQTGTSDQCALLISTNEEVFIFEPTVIKTGDSDGGDSCSFYGLNAAVLCKDGANVTIVEGTIESSANGANGVFCYGGNGGNNGAAGDGTKVIVSATSITTTGNNAGGIMTTGGGVTYVYDADVTTSGQSSAPIRTDRGGGTVYVSGGTYTSYGLGSPAIYSTAEIHASEATLESYLSEGVCIEGKNSIELVDCDLSANNTQCNGNATFLDSIMIYQSMSGDAASGTSSFTMTGGSLVSRSGHVFHVTNTNAIITLSDVMILNEDESDILLSVCADGWSGAGNIAALNAIGQTLWGTILVGSDSQLTLNLTEESDFTGTIGGFIQNAKGTTVSTEVGTVSVTLDDTSSWTLTADTYITAFSGDAANVISNGFTLYVNGVALEGTTD